MTKLAKLIADNTNVPTAEEVIREKIKMSSNIARDALKRASDFKSFIDALFETVANAYESYDIGVIPFVKIIIDAKKRRIVISDNGIGMSSSVGLIGYFALHAKTTRREFGLNMRGYNGTGKVAPFKYARRLEVSTVKDGLRSIVVLTADELEAADREVRAPEIKYLVKDHLTTDANGTTVTISEITKDFDLSGAGIRDIKDKISTEQMMWMKNAVISVNGDVVPFASVPNLAREPHNVTSPCGNFDLTIYYSNREMPAELQFVFISAGRVFVARENFGKEGSKYSPHIHVDVRASEAWAEEHFYDKREAFVSEDRSLKLKLTHPEALKIQDFISKEVGAFIRTLSEEEETRRRESMDDRRQALEKELSQIVSPLWNVFGGKKPSKKRVTEEDGDNVVHIIERKTSSGTSSTNPDKPEKKSSIGIAYDNLGEGLQYRIESGNKIVINLDYPTIKAVGNNPASPLYKLASLNIVGEAMGELIARASLVEEYGETGEMTVLDFLDARAKVTAGVSQAIAETSSIALLECVEKMEN